MKQNYLLSRLSFHFLFLISFCCLVSCEDRKEVNNNQREDSSVGNDSVIVVEEVKNELELVVNYYTDSIASPEELDSLLSNYTEDQQKIIYLLNRIEPIRVSAGTTLVLPDTVSTDLLNYSPFPEFFKPLELIPKTVLISQRIQAFGLYENGRLAHWGPVSSGKESTPTPNGLHYGNYKAKRKVSTVNSSWILPYYFNFMNFEGVGVHQYLLPGFPASHACVRLDMEDAQYIYEWANQWQLDKAGREISKNGTPFMVYGEYDFNNPTPPWLDLENNPKANDLNEKEIKTIQSYVNSYLQDEKNYTERVDELDLALKQ